ncbi:MAG: hypothetical protein ABSG15_14595 [FCB group bacterium]|jgi:hypothetical protein
MLSKEIILKRLALIKYLYKIGLDQSKQVETIASFSILTFHDSVEMFLKLIAEHSEIKSDNFNFLDYWAHIPTLTLKESMRSLNTRRVNIKHKGILLSISDIEMSRVITTDFFEQNVIIQCGIEFKDISLLNLINYENVRIHLEKAQETLNTNQIENSINESALAFTKLLDTYENSKTRNWYGDSPFFFGKDFTFLRSSSMDIENSDLKEFIDKVKGSLEIIQKAIKIISFGIDYKRFIKFSMLTPEVSIGLGREYILNTFYKKKWTKENCQYCIDFVLDCALKLQEFDFDIIEIEESEN